MKKLFKNFMMLTAVGAIAFLYSCSEEDEPTAAAPSISVSATIDADMSTLADGGNVVAGNTITVAVSATTPGGFNVVRASANGGTAQEFTRTQLQLDAGATTASFNITDIEISEEGVGTTVEWTFTVVDDLNQTGETTFSYTIDPIPSPDANTGMNELFGQLNANGGSFYDLMNDQVYGYAATRDEQTANVDFAFFYGDMSGYAIAALADESLQTAFESAGVPIDGVFDAAEFNETLFKALEATAEDFDAVVSEADLTNLFGEVAADATVANNLEVGSVFGFSLDGEKRQGLTGLMKVTETGGDSGASRTISFEIKYTSPVQ